MTCEVGAALPWGGEEATCQGQFSGCGSPSQFTARVASRGGCLRRPGPRFSGCTVGSLPAAEPQRPPMAPVDTQRTGRVVRTASQEGLTKATRCPQALAGRRHREWPGRVRIPRGHLNRGAGNR